MTKGPAMNPASDGGLLRAFQTADDQEAMAELLRRHGGMVLAAARGVVGDTGAAEDVAQATFLTLVRKAAALAGVDSLGGWLYHVAVCLARNERLKNRRRQAREKEAAMLANQPETHRGCSATAVAGLHEAIADLSAAYRVPLVLHYFEGKSYEVAAAELGLKPNAFGVRLNRAREKLRQRLVARGVTLGAAGVTGVLEEESATSAVLPAALVAATCQAASLLAAGKTLTGTGLVSAKVAYLTKSALKTLFWAKVKTAAAAVVLTASVAVGGGLAVHQALAHQPRVTPPPAVAAPKTGMAPIPGGTNAGREPDLAQPYSLTVEPFLMDRCEVTKALWDEVANWSRAKGYDFTGAGAGKAPDHPVHSVSWSDCVTWCNARSEKDGFAPVYYTDAAGTVVCRASRGGELNVKATADGYRLPTLGEWQYAARGGQPSHRFPWHDVETIDHSRANYRSGAEVNSDTSPTRGCHPAYAVDPQPYTSPVGAFAPNAYGLYDLLGNVSEWCFDSVAGLGRPDTWRLCCGGSWTDWALPIGIAQRKELPSSRPLYAGFRTVRTPRTPAVPGSPHVP